MAIPSGGGTEVLQRGWFPTLTNTNIYALFTGAISNSTTSNAVPSDHIITILNMNFTEAGNNSELINMWVDYGGTSSTYLLRKQPIGAYQTFMFTDKIILRPTDQLVFALDAAGNVDVSFNFIDQDWN